MVPLKETQIGTFSPNNHFGGGMCTMTAAKRMSAKHDFLDMLPSERKCDVELYEDCRAGDWLRNATVSRGRCQAFRFEGLKV